MANGTPKPAAKKPARRSSTARSEVTSDLRTVETHGLTLTIPAKMPFAVLQFLDSEEPGHKEIMGVLRVLLRPKEQIDQVWDADLDIEQGGELVAALINEYGVTPGGSQASPGS